GDVLQNAARAMGAADLKSIEYSGSGFNFALGQSVRPFAAWPKFNVKSYTRTIYFPTNSSREEMVRTQFENPPRGGGAQPIAGEQRQVQVVSGTHAWNVAGNNNIPAPAAATERMLALLMTPHAFLKAALARRATLTSGPVRSGRKTSDVASFVVDGKYTLKGVINDQGLVDRVETRIPNPAAGDILVEMIYSNYQDFGGVKFPTKIIQRTLGHPTLDITITEVKPNVAVSIETPAAVRVAAIPPVRVDSQKLADGVWYLTGGSHHSVAVEFRDYSVVIEAPLNEERSLAVIGEVKKLVPNKPIRYLVSTHHHFDHSGGVRTFVAEGATLITHDINKVFYHEVVGARRTLSPDKLSQTPKRLLMIEMKEKHVLSDGSRVVELHHIQGNAHHQGIIMAYLPKEKLLVEADVYTPGAANAPPPATPHPFQVNLYENIQRLNLAVDRIAPLHGRIVTMSDLLKSIGKAG
ncbi:MAG TPA: MBL fold metallo-hydrolase, partial [Blastocatellia bacterium]|nr:MBL fold metallo-hydrolase [Blastocatellia bacterium]